MKKYWYLWVILAVAVAGLIVYLVRRNKNQQGGSGILVSNRRQDENANIDNSTSNTLFSNKIILKKGDSGEQVKVVQRYFNEIYNCKLTVDGVWGDKTQAAVVKFEPDWKNGITSSQYNAIYMEIAHK